MSKVYTFSLAYNLTDEVIQSVERLFLQNAKFEINHLIVDCGFPLTEDEIPDDIEAAKAENSETLKELADNAGCDYLKIKNEGVSQNWQKVFDHINPNEGDILIGVDPDEIAIEIGWLKALTDVLRADHTLAYAAPLLIDAKPILDANIPEKEIGGYRVYDMKYASMNYGFLAIKADFIRAIGGIPIPDNMKVYGGLERMLLEKLKEHNLSWCILKDFTQEHTNNCKFYRAWKDDSIFCRAHKGLPQVDFEEWLKTKQSVANWTMYKNEE